MQNNLEEISFDEVINETGTSYAVFRTTLRPRYTKVLSDIIKGYFFLLLTSSLVFLSGQTYPSLWWLYIPSGSILIGYIAAYIALFIHEAGHYNIHPDKKINDSLATFFLCLPFGLSIKSYRKIHWQHHLHLGTPQDTETSYFNALTKLFILETLTGVHLLRTMLKKGTKNILTKEQRKQSGIMLFAGFLLHAIILAFSFLNGHWTFAITWILGFGIFFPFFATIRQILEHRDDLANHATNFNKIPHGKVSRLFIHTIFSSSFGAAGFTRHMIHHWDPQISYTRLKHIEDFLLHNKKTEEIIHSSKTSYSSVLKKLLAAP